MRTIRKEGVREGLEGARVCARARSRGGKKRDDAARVLFNLGKTTPPPRNSDATSLLA